MNIYRNKNLAFNALRRAFSKCYIATEFRAKKVSKTKKGVRGGRVAKCVGCKKYLPLHKLEVDHKKPVVPIGTKQQDMTLDEYFDRLFCEHTNLQLLCKECHNEKTKKENKRRKELDKKERRVNESS